jgi:hypothetical protein
MYHQPLISVGQLGKLRADLPIGAVRFSRHAHLWPQLHCFVGQVSNVSNLRPISDRPLEFVHFPHRLTRLSLVGKAMRCHWSLYILEALG